MKKLSEKPSAVAARKWRAVNHARRLAYEQAYRDGMAPDQRKRARAAIQDWKRRNPNRRYRQREADPIAFLLRKIKWRAKRDGIPFNVEAADFPDGIPTHCPVLGIPIVFPASGWTHGLPSFDRIIPELGYVKGNVVIISHRANTLKRDCTSSAELRAIADYIDRSGF